jgi:hypothetical protein
VKLLLITQVFLFSWLFQLRSQTDGVLSSVYLIGNTGLDTIPSEAMQLLAFECFDDTSSVVVMLGDNVFPAGISANSRSANARISARKLVSQFEMFVGFTGHFFVIPGDMDWRAGRSTGYSAILEQERLTNNWFKNSIVENRAQDAFLPSGGLPGPTHCDLPNSIRLIFLDTQWFLHRGLFKHRPRYPELTLRQSREQSLLRLDSLIKSGVDAGYLNIVLGHHPVLSNGRHTHVLEPIRSLVNYSPFQIFGLLGLNRFLSQDLAQPSYRKLRKRLHFVFSEYPGTIYASAHENNMQAFVKDSVYYLVSGSGALSSQLDRYRYPAIFMDDLQAGFLKLTLHQSGAVYLHAYGVTDRGEYWKKLLPFASDLMINKNKEEP